MKVGVSCNLNGVEITLLKLNDRFVVNGASALNKDYLYAYYLTKYD